MMIRITALIGVCLFFISTTNVVGQVDVDVNLNIKHSVDGISDFGRERHMTIHSSWTDREWNGHEDMLDYLINDLDVYFGRDNGSATWKSRLMNEDPNKPHWPDTEDMTVQGTNLKNWYETDPNFKNDYQYEGRGAMIMGMNPAPIYPTLAWDNNGWMNNGWQTWDVDASAFLVANYLDKYFAKSEGDLGEPLPTYWECINEPDMDMLTSHYMFLTSPEKLFEFHNEVALQTRALLGDKAPKIGGMTWGQHDFHAGDLVYRRDTQFYYDYSTEDIYPQYDNMLESDIWPHSKDSWFQWDGMWQAYIDATGENMDFHGVHIYDWPKANDEGIIRTGGHIEAMLDLMEWYDIFKNDEKKDIVLSEFGSVSPLVDDLPYKRRDWENLRPFNQMFMQFLERPSHVVLTMPFAPAKAQWGDWFDANGNLTRRYPTTLMDPVGDYSEKPGTSRYDHTEWEWSANILFFEQWSDVKGTRIDTKTGDPDILADAYVDGKHVHLILSNLELDPTTIELNLFDDYQNEIVSVNTKHLYLNTSSDLPVLDRESMSSAPGSILLEKSATIILDYEFADNVIIDQESVETKFMGEPLTSATNTFGSQLCHVEVAGRQSFTANIDNVVIPAIGEAQLRIGVQTPNWQKMEISINGHVLRVETDPSDWRGREMGRGALGWFGVFELDVPLEYLQANNEIVCQNNGNKSTYSSFQIQTWDFTKSPMRSENGDKIAVTGISLGEPISVMQGETKGLSVDYTPVNASNKGITWESSDLTVATVNDKGVVTTVASSGTTTITATSTDGGFTTTKEITAIPYLTTPVSSVDITDGDNITIEHYTETPLEVIVYPLDASIQEVVWSSSDPDVVHVNPQTGKLRGKTLNTTATVTATVVDTESGDAVFTDEIEVFVSVAGAESVFCRDLPATLQPFQTFSVDVPVRITGARDVVIELSKDDVVLGTGSSSVNEYGEVTVSVEYNLESVPTLGTGYVLTARLTDGSTELDVCSQEVEMIDHIRAASISITEGIRTVQTENSIQLVAEILPQNVFNKAINWSSSNEAIATVTPLTGMVTGLAAGEVTITATSDDLGWTDDVTITVQSDVVTVPIESIELSHSELLLYVGNEVDIVATLEPSWTTQADIIWSSSNESIASVDQTGHVAATYMEGEVVITATSVDNDQVYTQTAVSVSKTLVIQAEDMDRTGGTHDGWEISDIGINYNQSGDWGEFDVVVPEAGEYGVRYFIAAPATSTDAGINIYVNGEFRFKTVVPPGTGWDDYVAIDATSTVLLTEGSAVIRFESTGSTDWQWNMDKIEMTNMGSSNVESINVTPETLTLGIAQTRSITAQVLPDNAIDKSVVWLSSNTSIATINETTGEITGISEGEVTITATTNDGGFMDFCTVTVQGEAVVVKVSELTVLPSNAQVSIGGNIQLSASTLPIDADDQTMTWSSSDDAIATVEASTGLVSGVSQGQVTITATANDGSGISATSTIDVLSIVYASIAFDDVNNYSGVDFETGGEIKVSCSFEAGTGKVLNEDGITFWLRQVTEGWTDITKDVKVQDVSVVGQQNGIATGTISLEGLSPSDEIGTDFYFLWISMTPEGGALYNKLEGISPISIVPAKIVNVSSVSLSDDAESIEVGTTYTLDVIIEPSNATNKNVSWSSDNTNVATIANGVVTGISAGTAKITVTTEDGGLSDAFTVTVDDNPATVAVTGVTIDDDIEIIEQGATYTLVALIAPENATNKGVSWSSSNTAVATVNDGVVTGVSVGTANVTVTTNDGDKTAMFTITVVDVEAITAIEDHIQQLEVYPNPASSEIKIKNLNGYHHVSIISLIGSVLYEQSITGSELTIDISNFTNGLYLMRIRGENSFKNKRFRIQN